MSYGYRFRITSELLSILKAYETNFQKHLPRARTSAVCGNRLCETGRNGIEEHVFLVQRVYRSGYGIAMRPAFPPKGSRRVERGLSPRLRHDLEGIPGQYRPAGRGHSLRSESHPDPRRENDRRIHGRIPHLDLEPDRCENRQAELPVRQKEEPRHRRRRTEGNSRRLDPATKRITRSASRTASTSSWKARRSRAVSNAGSTSPKRSPTCASSTATSPIGAGYPSARTRTVSTSTGRATGSTTTAASAWNAAGTWS